MEQPHHHLDCPYRLIKKCDCEMIEQDSWVYDTTMNVVDRSDDELEDAITELNVRLAEYHEQHMDAPAEHKYLLGKLSELENMVRLRTFTALHRSINDADQHVVWEYRKRVRRFQQSQPSFY